jgi:hypothetical protein
MNKQNKIYNNRFKKVYLKLKEQERVKDKTDLANKLGSYNSVVNYIINGKRSVTLDQLTTLIKKFGINANYIFGRSEYMFLSDLKMCNCKPFEILKNGQ